MRAVITGGSGFLGGRLAQMLAARGGEVTVLARPTSDLHHLEGVPLRVCPGDLRDPTSLAQAVAGATHIFHCAACSTDWAPRETYVAANITGTENLLAAARTVPTLERFLHVSTTDVYGYPLIPCTEAGPLTRTDLPYNQTKLEGERAVQSASQQHGVPITIVRPATIYGPRGKDFTVDIAALLRQRTMAVVDGGAAPGGFTYVDNVAQAMLDAALSPNTLGETYNLSDGTGTTWREYLARFAALLGAKPPWINLPFPAAIALATAMEAPHRYLGLGGRPLLTRHAVHLLGRNQEFPITKARTDFNFAPAISLEEGLERSANWLRTSASAQPRKLSR